jgi:deoxyribonuclease-1
MKVISVFLISLFCLVSTVSADINNFREAKIKLKEHVYFERSTDQGGTFYCGCDWRWVGQSGGRVDAASCGYQVRAQHNRAERTEWEHVVPAWVMGHQRQCWQSGGRKSCRQTDPLFRIMEANPHNLVVSVGEINADRSNYQFGELPPSPSEYGQCQFQVDNKQRVATPRNSVKGQIARTYFYIHDRYDLRMSRQQQQLMIAWNNKYPVGQWERKRDSRIAKIAGHHNPFVTGEQTWSLGHKNSAGGLNRVLHDNPKSLPPFQDNLLAVVRGNKNSNVYHLPEGCPSYNRVSPKNIVPFSSETEAKAAGFLKAGNCR